MCRASNRARQKLNKLNIYNLKQIKNGEFYS